jgi:cytoskeletal protein RodZ
MYGGDENLPVSLHIASAVCAFNGYTYVLTYAFHTFGFLEMASKSIPMSSNSSSKRITLDMGNASKKTACSSKDQKIKTSTDAQAPRLSSKCTPENKQQPTTSVYKRNADTAKRTTSATSGISMVFKFYE